MSFSLCVSWYWWRVNLFTVHFSGPGRAVSACLCVWTIHFTANNFLLGCLACWCTFTLSVSSLKVKITRHLWMWNIFWLFVELILCAKMVGVTWTEGFLVERVFVVSGPRRVSPVGDGWCLCFDCFDIACSVTARAYSRLRLVPVSVLRCGPSSGNSRIDRHPLNGLFSRTTSVNWHREG